MIIPKFIRRWFRDPYDGLRNLHTVEEGVLYRCGQPRPEQLGELIDRLGLKTVIALRGSRDPADPDSWEREERAICDAKGARFLTLPCNHRNPPTPDQVAAFLNVLRTPETRPALVHCRIGQQRTGMFCALFRVHIQGHTPEQALHEMDEFGFDSRNRRHQQLLKAYRELARSQPAFVAAGEPA